MRIRLGARARQPGARDDAPAGTEPRGAVEGVGEDHRRWTTRWPAIRTRIRRWSGIRTRIRRWTGIGTRIRRWTGIGTGIGTGIRTSIGTGIRRAAVGASSGRSVDGEGAEEDARDVGPHAGGPGKSDGGRGRV